MNLKPWHRLFGIALMGAIALEFLGEKTAPVEVWDYPLFFALMGLFGCFVLSLVAKGVVSPALDRPEDFYGAADAEGDWTSQSPAAREDAAKASTQRSGDSAESGSAGARPNRGTPGSPEADDAPNGGEG